MSGRRRPILIRCRCPPNGGVRCRNTAAATLTPVLAQVNGDSGAATRAAGRSPPRPGRDLPKVHPSSFHPTAP
eukprot:11945460-Alexandrium_andersonii.AAC.1